MYFCGKYVLEKLIFPKKEIIYLKKNIRGKVICREKVPRVLVNYFIN